MALNFFKQSDIDAMDAKNIPLRFKNYFKSLDYAGKVAILGNRYDLAEALGFKLPEEEDEEGYAYSYGRHKVWQEGHGVHIVGPLASSLLGNSITKKGSHTSCNEGTGYGCKQCSLVCIPDCLVI